MWPSCSLSIGLDASLLSHDPGVVEAYRRDPLVHNRMSAQTYCAILRVYDDALQRAPTLRVPTLLLYGTDDHIVSIEMATRWFSLLTCEKRAVAFPGAYHELHHEPIREEALRLVCDWVRRGS